MPRFIVLLFLVGVASAINFQLFPGVDKCFTVAGGQQYHVEYVVSGAEENATQFRVVHEQKVLSQQLNKSQHTDLLDLPAGDVHLCWRSTDKSHKFVSMDFFLAKDPIHSLITKRHIAQVEEVLNNAAEGLATVGRNQLYQIERDSVHKGLLEQTDNRISWTGIIKIVVLILSAMVQVWVMRGFFKASGMSYSEVAS